MKQHFFSLDSVYPVDHLCTKKIENLKIIWPEEYKRKIGSNQDDKSVHMMELIPGNESIDKWIII